MLTWSVCLCVCACHSVRPGPWTPLCRRSLRVQRLAVRRRPRLSGQERRAQLLWVRPDPEPAPTQTRVHVHVLHEATCPFMLLPELMFGILMLSSTDDKVLCYNNKQVSWRVSRLDVHMIKMMKRQESVGFELAVLACSWWAKHDKV